METQLQKTETKTKDIVAHGTSTLMALPGKGLKIALAKFLPGS